MLCMRGVLHPRADGLLQPRRPSFPRCHACAAARAAEASSRHISFHRCPTAPSGGKQHPLLLVQGTGLPPASWQAGLQSLASQTPTFCPRCQMPDYAPCKQVCLLGWRTCPLCMAQKWKPSERLACAQAAMSFHKAAITCLMSMPTCLSLPSAAPEQ